MHRSSPTQKKPSFMARPGSQGCFETKLHDARTQENIRELIDLASAERSQDSFWNAQALRNRGEVHLDCSAFRANAGVIARWNKEDRAHRTSLFKREKGRVACAPLQKMEKKSFLTPYTIAERCSARRCSSAIFSVVLVIVDCERITADPEVAPIWVGEG
jgi:hypothetical protein